MNEQLLKIPAYWGKNIKSSELAPTSLYEILTQMASAEWIVKRIEQVRAIVDLQQRQEAKAALLPYFVLNKFKENYRKNENLLEANYIVADFDHLEPSRMLEVQYKLREDQRVFLYFRSPSNDGLKILFKLEAPITDPKFFTAYYIDTITTISKEYGVKPDMSCKDPARAIFYSHDEEPYVNIEARALKVISPKGGILKGRPPSQNVSVGSFSTNTKLLEMFGGAAPGGRTAQMTQLIGLCIDRGMSADLCFHFIKLWNEKNTPPHTEKKLTDTIADMYGRYKKSNLPFEIVEKDNQYYRLIWGNKDSNEDREKLLTTFRIDAKELLVTKEGDVLHCDIISCDGAKYEDVIIEPSEWTSENLHNNIGHMDCTVVATDPEVKVLKMYINNRIPIRKNGTKIVGLNDSSEIWVTKHSNITKDGRLDKMEIIPYDRGGDSFYNKVEYIFQDDSDFMKSATKFYDLILKINEPQAIVPFIGWNFIAPIRKVIMDIQECFPVLFVPGTMGSGKTSTAKLFQKLHGYIKPDIASADMRKFPMLKALSSTNGIPIFIDEFKQSDMTDFTTNDIHRYIRKSFDGGLESKGHADQTTSDYHLLAPWVLLGEWSIKNPAERERMIIPRFSTAIKTDEEMQKAYIELFNNTELRGFMPRYMQWVLNQDLKKLYNENMAYCVNHFKGVGAAPRIMKNLVVMTMGINLFIGFAKFLNLPEPLINLPTILNGQLEEITGNSTGQVESSFDQLIGEMSKMAIREKNDATGLATGNTKEPWFTLLTHKGIPALAIYFILAHPKVKEFAKKTQADVDILDEKGYRRMMTPKETKYIISSSEIVSMGGRHRRCVVLDITKMESMGVNIEGFKEQ